ncbi:MAG: hypothetical protein IJY91_06485 [Oscillospiraceae bacterium]|nr:hypothetical protein [Oscillospiraceae bacterium]
MGFPYFNPPHIQKQNTIETGNYFAPKPDMDAEEITKEVSPKRKMIGKIVTIGIIIVAAIALVLLGIWVFQDYPGGYLR